MARAVRSVSCACFTPMETATISSAAPFSLRRMASSTAISSKGLTMYLRLSVSMPEPSGLTLILTS